MPMVCMGFTRGGIQEGRENFNKYLINKDAIILFCCLSGECDDVVFACQCLFGNSWLDGGTIFLFARG